MLNQIINKAGDFGIRIAVGRVIQVRKRSGKFKPKIARSLPRKTPSALALDHFDFYCGPIFGKNWPSIRAALLSPHKYIAVVNAFSLSSDATEAILRDRGALNFIDELLSIESKRQCAERANKTKTDDIATEKSSKADDNVAQPSFDEEPAPRDEFGLSDFQPSKRTFSLGELEERPLRTGNDDLIITGFEGHGSEIPKKDHVIQFPKRLRLYVHPRNDLTDFPSPDKDSSGVPTWWLLDGGSVIPVLALNLQKGETMLDMCAAPGGKSLLSVQTLLLDRLVCNDAKMSRLGQLRHALASFIPSTLDVANRVILKHKNAANIKTWDELEAYDKVLVDAPCTTDRLSVSTDENNIFSLGMTNERLNLPELQTKLLINGLRSLKPGGSLVYSTCALSPVQNEVVVENAVALAKEKFNIEVNELSLSMLITCLRKSGLYRIWNCNVGALILPFLPSNFGPMYFCKLQRV
uniref:NOL1/NOP2/Sun domain family member 4 n=1 Tax=Syphacia muris TaxID=451379 RepID=A0A0N5B146_9BILA